MNFAKTFAQDLFLSESTKENPSHAKLHLWKENVPSNEMSGGLLSGRTRWIDESLPGQSGISSRAWPMLGSLFANAQQNFGESSAIWATPCSDQARWP
jgi:hypothetical protein